MQKNKGDYKVAVFDSPGDSIIAYMLNLNRHSAYAASRDKRADLRNGTDQPTGLYLLETLDNYSQRGEDYVKGLRNLITYNNLTPADHVYFDNKEALIELVPVMPVQAQ